MYVSFYSHGAAESFFKVLINPFSGAADRFCSQTGDFLGLHAIKFFQVLCEITFELDSRISFLSN